MLASLMMMLAIPGVAGSMAVAVDDDVQQVNVTTKVA